MTSDSSIITASQRLEEAASSHKPCEPIRNLIGATDIESAYKVQSIISNNRIKRGSNVVGKKVGLTSFAVQAQLGVDQPDFGVLYNDMEVLNGWELPFENLIQGKIEAEIAFVLSKDIDNPNIGTAEMLSSIDYAVSALEIVGSRVANWDIKITDTIADNASASHYVLGHSPMKLSQVDLVNCKMQMTKNGKVVSEGTGSACLGSPINAAIWLARKMSILGTPLAAGDVILSGALGPMSTIEPGDTYVTKIEGFGDVKVSIGHQK